MKWILLIGLACNITAVTAQQTTSTMLSKQEQSLVAVSALTATGNTEKLNPELANALDAGLTVNQLKEALTQLYAYCGFPRSLNALNAFCRVIEERKTRGIKDIEGEPIKQNDNIADKYEQGRKTLEQLTQTPQQKPATGFGEFAPRIDAFLKEHLFADIFASEVLSYRQRELVTIAALASKTGVEPQLKSHISIGKNTGVTETELALLAELIETHINTSQANTIRAILDKPTVPTISPDMLVRISEIEVYPEFLEEYKAILKEEGAASVDLEPGVISIFPMSIKEQPNHIRILEIYRDQAAYQSHLQTPHFQHYKTTTLKMVKELKLVDMDVLDTPTMEILFLKLNH